jgi:hypothetical protein
MSNEATTTAAAVTEGNTEGEATPKPAEPKKKRKYKAGNNEEIVSWMWTLNPDLAAALSGRPLPPQQPPAPPPGRRQKRQNKRRKQV